MKTRGARPLHRDSPVQPDLWDVECQDAKRAKFKALRKFRTSNNGNDLTQYSYLKRRFKSVCKVKKRAFENRRRKNLVNCNNNPNAFWQQLKRYSKSASNSQDTSNVSSESWLHYFEGLLNRKFVNDNQNESVFDNLAREVNSDELNYPISREEIRNSVQALNSNRASGTMEMYKHTIDLILPYLHILFNSVYDSGGFPEEWSESIITPIHKKGSKCELNNFRAVSLINTLSKIFMHILTRRLTTWCDDNTIINESQTGFRSKYSITDNI